MGNDQHEIVEVDEPLLKPGRRGKVQAVRRLVHQDNVRVSEQRSRDQHLTLFRAGKRSHQHIMLVFFNAETI